MAEKVPVNVADNATAKVEELGFKCELDQMIDHALKTAPRLREIRVMLADTDFPNYCGPDVIVWLLRREPPEGAAADRTDWNLWGWLARNVPSHASSHIAMWSTSTEPY